MSVEPHIDPPPLHGIVPTPGLWRNGAFVRVWTAATISVMLPSARCGSTLASSAG